MKLSTLSKNTLKELKAFLTSISEITYKKPINELSNASIGQHTRHIIEFYICLVNQIKGGDTVNYDKRLRNSELEMSLEAATKEIDSLCNEINNIVINQTINIEGSMGTSPYSVSSSTERELLHVLEHANHHMAVIKIATKILDLKIELAPNFGIAASTTAYKKCAQ